MDKKTQRKYDTITAALSNVNGATFISFDSLTDVPLLGGMKNPMKDRVKKRTIGNVVMVFTNKNSNGYDNMVRRRLEQEGKDPDSFKLGERKFGTRVEGTPIIEHGEEKYLEVIFLKAGKSCYELDGSEIADHAIIGLNPTNATGEQGGLEKKVIIRTFKFSSIIGLTVDKQRFDF